MVVRRYFHPRETHSASRALRRRTSGGRRDALPAGRHPSTGVSPCPESTVALAMRSIAVFHGKHGGVIPRGRSSKHGAPTSNTQLEARHEAKPTTSPRTATPLVQHEEANHPNSPRVSREAAESPNGPFGRVMICDCGRVEVTDFRAGTTDDNESAPTVSRCFRRSTRVRSVGTSDAREGGPLFHVKPEAAVPLVSLRASDSWAQLPRHHLACKTPPMLSATVVASSCCAMQAEMGECARCFTCNGLP